MAQAQSVSATAATRATGTFSAFQNSNFRLYFIGQLISTSGTWMQIIAQGYLVYKLTQSELWLGIVACAAGAPMLFVAPFAGVFVERLPRRAVLVWTQSILMLLAFILAALVVTDTVQIWHIVALALALGTVNAFDAPARQAIISDMIDKELLSAGIAMNSIIVNGSRALGPTAATAVLATLGAGWCFFLNGLSFVAVIVTLLMLHMNPHPRPVKFEPALKQMREGLAYVRHHTTVLPLLLLSAGGAFFCWATLALFPSFADVILHSPTDGYGIISATNGVGAVIAGLLVGTMSNRFGRGRVMIVTGVGTAISIVALALTTTIPAAAVVSLVFGFCVIGFFVNINTAIQLEIPNEFRGRVLSLYTLSIIGLNPFGSLLLGFVAQVAGDPIGLALYGVIVGVIVVTIASRFPQVWEI
ncbi:MAG TPA: MFS transporter [Phototrophicaceae bacterium]|jgi:MFS family permease|nr:MFS transporter [Phototrophicaceae bacterium]